MVLENKLKLNNSSDLAREEEKISKQKAIEMFIWKGLMPAITMKDTIFLKPKT